MIGIILAAGKGTRMRPLTNDKPKAMVEVAGKPMIEYSMDKLVNKGVDSIKIVVGYKKNVIKDYFGYEYKGLDVEYYNQEEQEGTAHALRQVDVDDKFMLLLCDSMYEEEFTDSEDEFVVYTKETSYEDAKTHGVVETDENEYITDLVEKPDNPPSNKIITGAYILPEDFIDYCYMIDKSDRGEYEVTDAIQKYVDKGGVIKSKTVNGWRYNVNDKETKEEVTKLIQ